MPTIAIHGIELEYHEDGIILFEEGMIGMPNLRRFVLIRQEGIEPFLWLASLDAPHTTFLVTDARDLFGWYQPETPDDVMHRLGLEPGERPLVLSPVTIAQDWHGTTVNLRAPIFVCAGRMRGAQAILATRNYRLNERLPVAEVA